MVKENHVSEVLCWIFMCLHAALTKQYWYIVFWLIKIKNIGKDSMSLKNNKKFKVKIENIYYFTGH